MPNIGERLRNFDGFGSLQSKKRQFVTDIFNGGVKPIVRVDPLEVFARCSPH